MNFSELRLKTGLLGFSPRDLNAIFADLDGEADQVLTGHRPVPDRVAQIVGIWWEEVTTAVHNAVDDARRRHAEDPHHVTALIRYGKHHLLPEAQGAQASSLQSWDYHLGLILKGLEAVGVPYEITTVQE